MVVLYYTKSNKACRAASAWFQERNISVHRKHVRSISKSHLLYSLSLSENGFNDLLKRTSNCDAHVKVVIEKIQSVSFNEGVSLVLKHPEVLRMPLIIDKDKIVTGFHPDRIRIFIPHYYRRIECKI